MKELVKFEKAIGTDGATVGGAVGVEESNLKLEIHAEMPLIKIIDPATKALDGALDKLKAAIPGTWDDALIDQIKAQYKADLVKMLAE